MDRVYIFIAAILFSYHGILVSDTDLYKWIDCLTALLHFEFVDVIDMNLSLEVLILTTKQPLFSTLKW